jgi:hypothetical protein
MSQSATVSNLSLFTNVNVKTSGLIFCITVNTEAEHYSLKYSINPLIRTPAIRISNCPDGLGSLGKFVQNLSEILQN